MNIPGVLAVSLAHWVISALSVAEASGGGEARVDPRYARECGECHAPYPVRWLSAESWRTVLADLNRHFGQDATMDAGTQNSLRDYLISHARRLPTIAPDGAPLLRVTQSPGFRRAHDEVSPATWKRSDVQSPASCGACHGGAAEGRFSEHDLILPKGVHR